MYIGGTIIELLGWIGTRYFFLKIPSYSEIEWKSGLIELHVIVLESGISIYYQYFEKQTIQCKDPAEFSDPYQRIDSHLIAGGLVGIKAMLDEIAQTRGSLETIQIGNKFLIFKQGKKIMTFLLADKNLGVYHSILLDLTKEIEAANPTLANFKGDIKNLSISPIIDRHF